MGKGDQLGNPGAEGQDPRADHFRDLMAILNEALQDLTALDRDGDSVQLAIFALGRAEAWASIQNTRKDALDGVRTAGRRSLTEGDEARIYRAVQSAHQSVVVGQQTNNSELIDAWLQVFATLHALIQARGPTTAPSELPGTASYRAAGAAHAAALSKAQALGKKTTVTGGGAAGSPPVPRYNRDTPRAGSPIDVARMPI